MRRQVPFVVAALLLFGCGRQPVATFAGKRVTATDPPAVSVQEALESGAFFTPDFLALEAGLAQFKAELSFARSARGLNR